MEDDCSNRLNSQKDSQVDTAPTSQGWVTSVDPSKNKILEQSRLLAQVASSVLTKEKKLAAVKHKLKNLKSVSYSRDSNCDFSKPTSSDSDSLLINMYKQYEKVADDPSDGLPTDEPVHDVKLDVRDAPQPAPVHQPVEDWAVSSLSEKDMQDLSAESLQIPSPHHRISTQGGVHQVLEENQSIVGTADGKIAHTFAPGEQKSISECPAASTGDIFKQHAEGNPFSDITCAGAPAIVLPIDLAQNYANLEGLSSHKNSSLPEMVLAAGRSESFGSKTWMSTTRLVKNLTYFAPSFLLSGRKGMKRVRFNLQEPKNNTHVRDKSSKPGFVEILYQLGTFWNNFNLPTILTCTWEVFFWPFKLALAPENEYAEIRETFSKNWITSVGLNDIITVVNFLIDLVFILDITFKIVGQAVLDEDEYQEKEREARKARNRRLKAGKKGENFEEPHSIEHTKLHLGRRTTHFIQHRLPMYLFGCVFSYFPYAFMCSYWMEICFNLPRLYRIILLFQFIRQKELDVYFEVRTVAFFKFCLTVFGVAHWTGCLFYWIPRVQDFPNDKQFNSWLNQFELNSGVPFVREKASIGEQYMVILYRGFNAITNLAYEPLIPKRTEEMIACTVSIFSQLFIEAYVLGTLFHYLVKKDTAQEEYAKLMAHLQEYSEARNLPKSLQERLVSYFEFQKSKHIQDDGLVLRSLPNSLKMKFTNNKYSHVFEQNCALFRGCNTLFLNQITVKLKEFYLMPGETMLRQGEMPRELCFVKMGIVEASKDDVLLRRIRFDSEGSTSLGEVAFFMGIAQREAMTAVQTGDVTLVIFSKLDYEDLMVNYPEQHDIILTNILSQYDLDKNGNEMGHKTAMNEENTSFMEMQQAIQAAIQKRNSDALSTITYAASNGDVDTVKNLLARGVPINQGDYDNRTTLHLAASEGNIRVVEALLQEGADPNVKDRWGGTPLSDAITNNRAQVVEILHKAEAHLVFEQPANMLCGAAAMDDVATMEAYLDNGVDPDCSDYDQRSSLHLSASEGKLRVAEFLIRSGAKVNCVDRWGSTPLVDAVRGGHEMLIKLIRNKNGLLPSSFGGDALCQACADGDIYMINLLLEAGVDVNTCDYDKRSALHVAASEGQLVSVYFLVCKNADIHFQDRWRSTPLQDALEGVHLDCARVLHSFGGLLGDSGDESLLKLLDRPDCPHIRDVWKQIRQLNDMVSGNKPKGYLMSTDMDEVIKFNQKVLISMIEVLGNVKSACVLVHEQLTMLKHSWSPLIELFQLLLGETGFVEATKSSQEDIGQDQNEGLLLDMTLLPSPRTQVKPGFVPNLQLPGTLPPEPSSERPISIFDNFDALLERDASQTAGQSNQKLPEEEASYTYLSQESLDTRGKDIHKLILKFASVEVTVKDLEERLVDVCAYSIMDALKIVFSGMGIEDFEQHIHNISLECKMSKEDVEDDMIGAISLPGLIASTSFLNLLESDQRSIANAHKKYERQREFKMQLIHTICVIATLFGVFDGNKDGVVEMAEVDALTSYMGTLMGDIMSNGIERYHGGKTATLTYRQFVACILIYLDLEKDGSEGTVDSYSEGTWSHAKSDDGLPDVQEVEEAEAVRPRVSQIEASRKPSADPAELQAKFDTAFGNVVAKRQSLRIADAPTGDRPMRYWYSKLRQLVATLFCMGAHRGASKVVDTQATEMNLEKDKKKLLNFEEFSDLIHQVQDSLGQTLSKAQLKELFSLYDTKNEGVIGFEAFQDALTEHIKEHGDIVGMLAGTGFHTKSRLLIDVHARWLPWWDALVIKYLTVLFFFEVPFNICFQAAVHLGSWYFIGQHLMDAILWTDMLMRFFRPYVNENSVLEVDLGSIRRHYLGSLFPVDLVASFPVDLLVFTDGATYSYMALLRLFRLVRFYQLYQWNKHKGRSTVTAKFYAGLKRLMPIMIGSSHILGCIWWYIGTYKIKGESDLMNHWIGHYEAFGTGNVFKDANVLQQYILSFFWATASLSTNGQIGNSTPKSFTEMMFACFIMLTSLTVYVYLLSELSDLVMNQDQELVVTRRQVQTVQNFIKANEVPPVLAQEIIEHFEIITSQSTGKSDSIEDSVDIFSMLSHSLQVEVARNISHALVESCYVFDGCDSNFLDSICVLLREVTVPPENYLFRINEVSKDLYIIARGSVELLNEVDDAGEVVSDTLEQGMLVGELGFFFGMRQTMHARTPSGNPTTLFGMDKNDYQQLAKLYFDAEEQITRNILEFWDDTGKSGRSTRSTRGQVSSRNSELVSGRSTTSADGKSENGMTAIREMLKVAQEKRHNERIGRIIDAAAVNDLEEVRRVFEGADISVDDSDYDQRTPLHLAASNGHLNMVKHLVIVHGADINVVDRYNGTPISDAVKGRFAEVASFLRKQGAVLQHEDPAGVLCQAAADGDLDYLKMLIDNGLDPNAADYDSRTPLHLAASNNHLDCIKYLCRIPHINVNATDRTGGTPLQDAVRHRHKEARILLRDAGGNFGNLDVAGVLCTAGAENDLEMIQIMCHSGVDMNSTDYDFRTALHLAASNGSLEVASFLLQQPGIEVNPVDRKKCTPMEDAVRHGQDVIYSLLKKSGGVRSNHPSVLEYLEQNSAKRKAQKEANLSNRTMRVVQATLEHGLIKRLETIHAALEMHAIDMQKACLIFFDSFQSLLTASMTGKAWCPNLEMSEKNLNNSQKQILFRTREVIKILTGQDIELCLKSRILRVMEHDTVALVKDLAVLLRKAKTTIVEVVEQAQSNSYYFDTFQQEYNRKEKEKRQAKVKKKIMKLGIQRMLTSMSEGDLLQDSAPAAPT